MLRGIFPKYFDHVLRTTKKVKNVSKIMFYLFSCVHKNNLMIFVSLHVLIKFNTCVNC